MIYDKFSNARFYVGLSPLLAKAFALIAEGHDFDREADDCWRYVDGEKLYYKVTDIRTEEPPLDTYRYEFHKRYVDIHYLLSGREGIAVGDLSQMTPDGAFSFEKDCGFAKGKRVGLMNLRPGDFMICFPNDGHKCWIGNGETIRKVLFKVSFDSFQTV